MTNSDKIRSMSDEELCALLIKENDNHLCALEIFEEGASCRSTECEYCIQKWLKEESEEKQMTATEYQKMAMRTNDGKSTTRMAGACAYGKELEGAIDTGGIVNACLGLSGEVGEFNDLIKKWIFHEKPIDIDHAKKELGDCMWYIALMCESFGWDLGEIMQMNIDKLVARYPEGFDVQRANNRKDGDV